MRPFAFASLLALASFTLVAGACNFKLGDDTEGEMGNLRFSYSGTGCFFGCGLDKKVLQGSTVSVSVKGDAQGGLTAAIDEGSAASVSTQTETCTCNSKSGSTSNSRLVQGGVRCESGETKSCSLSVDVSADHEGFSKLKVLDGKGAVVDQVDVTTRVAARLDLAITADDVAVAPKDGVYTMKSRAEGKIVAKAFDGDGDELLFSQNGFDFRYDDPHLRASNDDWFLVSANTSTFRSLAAGDATIHVAAANGRTTADARLHFTE
jgi:hypothetical protein